MNSQHHFFLKSFLFLVPCAGLGCAPPRVVLVPEAEHSIVVSGQGEVYAAPDQARVHLGIEEHANGAEEAMKRANERMAQIIAALKALGVEEKNIQTAELSMFFEHLPDAPVYPPSPVPMREVAPDKGSPAEKMAAGESTPAVPAIDGAYVVRNTVHVTISQISAVGAYIGAAMSAGANSLYGLELTIEDPTKLRDEARKRAIQNARAKAELLAKEAKVALGPVISINEVGGGEPVPMRADRAMGQKSAAVPVETGELSLTQHVQVTFAIQGSAEKGQAEKSAAVESGPDNTAWR